MRRRYVTLVPKDDSPSFQAVNPPKKILIDKVDTNYWWGTPVKNPRAGVIAFPKFAWKEYKK